jgi:hypothetical protein
MKKVFSKEKFINYFMARGYKKEFIEKCINELNINFIKDIENAVNQAEVMDNKNMLYIFYKKETYLLPLFLCDEWMEEVEGESIQERTERHFREIGGETITIRKGRKENERFNQIRKA